jgi:hypothetical protein
VCCSIAVCRALIKNKQKLKISSVKTISYLILTPRIDAASVARSACCLKSCSEVEVLTVVLNIYRKLFHNLMIKFSVSTVEKDSLHPSGYLYVLRT